METKPKKRLIINKYAISCSLAFIYIFFSYMAHDIVFSSSLQSLSLYAFFLSAVFILVTEMRVEKARLTFAVWYVLFMCASMVMMLFTPDMSKVFNGLYSMLVSLLVALSLQIHVKSDKQFRAMLRCFAVSAFALVMLLLLTGNLSGTADERLGEEIFGNANKFATIMMIGAVHTIWLVVYDSPKAHRRILYIAMLIMDMYALALSGGRKFFIIPMIFLYILLWFKHDKRGRKHIILYSIFFAGLFVLIWHLIMNVPVLYDAIGVRMQGLTDHMQGVGGDSSSVIREKIRNLAFEKWFENPLFGYGFDSFKFLALKEVGHFYYSHCNYSELLYNGGIFYFLLYYWIYFKILRNAFKNKELPSCYKAFAVGIVISFFIYEYGGITYNTTPQLILLMLAHYASIYKPN